MKLVIVVVQGSDADSLLAALTERGIRATQITSAGGFLREQNVTLMIGVDAARVTEVGETVRSTCHSRTRFVNPLMPIVEPGEFYVPNPVEVVVGGATMFVLAVERFERLGIA